MFLKLASGIIFLLVSSIGLAKDNASSGITNSAVFIGTWDITVNKTSYELALWYENKKSFNKILAHVSNTPFKEKITYAGYVRSKDNRCNMYINGRLFYQISRESRDDKGKAEYILSVIGQSDLKESFKSCKKVLSFGLYAEPTSTNKLEYRSNSKSNIEVTRVSASNKVASAVATGRPEYRKPGKTGYMSRSVPTSIELKMIKNKSQIWPVTAAAKSDVVKSKPTSRPMAIDTILYQSEKLTITPVWRKTMAEWCASENEKVGHTVVTTYTSEHDERRNLFNTDYEKFIETKIHPAIKKLCGRKTNFIVMFMRKKGESKNWDQLAFRLKNGSVYKSIRTSGAAPKKYKTVEDTLKPGERRTLAKHEIWYILCEKGPFCDLPGGLYLNAIYNNDVDLLKILDKRFNRFVKRRLKDHDSKIGWDVIGFGFGAIYSDQSVLIGLADKYTHDYQTKYRSCLKSNAQSKTFTYEVKPTHWETLSGMYAGSSPGYKVSATYTVNPELFPLVEKIGNHNGGSWWKHSYDILGSKSASYTIEGLLELQYQFSCKSAEVKRFEKNLLTLTERYLKDPKVWHAERKKL